MSLQFKRQARIEIDNNEELLLVEGLRISFALTRTSLGYPNLGELQIYGLDEAKLQQITKRLSVVRVFAGYGEPDDPLPMIYEANLSNFYKSRQGADSIITIITGSGRRSWELSTFMKTYNAGVSPKSVIKDAARSFQDVTLGALVLPDNMESSLYPQTFVGNSQAALDTLAEMYNFDWSIDQNQLDIIGRNLVATDRAIFNITPETGLIGSPTLTELGADFRVLLNPDITVGRQVFMDSTGVQLSQASLEFRKVRTTADGLYKVKETRMIGDTRGLDWYSDIIGWRTADEPRRFSN